MQKNLRQHSFWKTPLLTSPTELYTEVSDRYRSLVDSLSTAWALSPSFVQLLVTTNASVHVQQRSKAASLSSTDHEPMEKNWILISTDFLCFDCLHSQTSSRANTAHLRQIQHTFRANTAHLGQIRHTSEANTAHLHTVWKILHTFSLWSYMASYNKTIYSNNCCLDCTVHIEDFY